MIDIVYDLGKDQLDILKHLTNLTKIKLSC